MFLYFQYGKLFYIPTCIIIAYSKRLKKESKHKERERKEGGKEREGERERERENLKM